WTQCQFRMKVADFKQSSEGTAQDPAIFSGLPVLAVTQASNRSNPTSFVSEADCSASRNLKFSTTWDHPRSSKDTGLASERVCDCEASAEGTASNSAAPRFATTSACSIAPSSYAGKRDFRRAAWSGATASKKRMIT